MSAALLLDLVLATGLILLVIFSLCVRDLFTSIVTFMIVGLLMSLAWVRLWAPDLALAEAAIGSGITGALFLGAMRRLEGSRPDLVRRGHEKRPGIAGAAPILGAIGFIGILSALEFALVPQLTRAQPIMAEPVMAALESAGADNPVTAIILNIRAYDTLLELAVLLLAWSGVRVLQGPLRGPGISPATGELAVLGAFARFMSAPAVLMAGYLVWAGKDVPGGAFQAGALLAGVGAVTLMAGRPLQPLYREALMRPMLAAGLLTFLVVAVGSWRVGGEFLGYRYAHAGTLMLVLELFSTAAIATVLLMLFAACAFRSGGSPSGRRSDSDP